IVSDPRYDGVNNRRVFFGNDGGVYKADDIQSVSTLGFTPLNNTLGVTQFYGGAANPSGTVIGGAQDNGTLLWTEASATSWSETLGGDGGFVAADPVDGSVLYSET